LDGGNGVDTADFTALTVSVTVDLGIGSAQSTGDGMDTFIRIENVRGSDTAGDILTGDFFDNTLFGQGGDDILAGGEGNDTLNGGSGIDTADYSLSVDGVVVNLSNGAVNDDGSGGLDTLISIENIIGSEFDDLLVGSGAANVLTGGIGRDIMTGNNGADIFVFRDTSESGLNVSSWDVITDLSAIDRIDLSQIDADTDFAGDQAFFEIIASGVAFTLAGQLRLTDGVLYGNTDSDADAEFAIQLDGVTSLTLAQFIL
jgi:Ca2+-binding RTX toxin-like protein